jgi:hypothetical protein
LRTLTHTHTGRHMESTFENTHPHTPTHTHTHTHTGSYAKGSEIKGRHAHTCAFVSVYTHIRASVSILQDEYGH